LKQNVSGCMTTGRDVSSRCFSKVLIKEVAEGTARLFYTRAAAIPKYGVNIGQDLPVAIRS